MKYHSINSRLCILRTNPGQRFVIGLKPEMSQYGPSRLDPIYPVESLFIVTVRLMRGLAKRLDNPKRHAGDSVEHRIFEPDNVGRISEFAIEEKTERNRVAVILMENLDLQITDANRGAGGDGNGFHRWYEIAR